MELCWLEYATDRQPADYGLAGDSGDARWEVTFSGLLIRHPKGDLLIDVGNSSHFRDELGDAGLVAGLLLRAYPGAGNVVATAPEALGRVGEAPSRLTAIVASHVHADHVGGIMDLPGTAVALSEEELQFFRAEKDEGHFDVVRAHAEAILRGAKPVRFTSTPYENFDRSLDWFGDGSVVFVPLFGHTPGSMGTFVNRTPTERYFHIGDAADTLEAVYKRRGKSVVMDVTDHDSKQADAVVAKLAQLHEQDPALVILPAHDRKAWASAFGAPGHCVGAAR